MKTKTKTDKEMLDAILKQIQKLDKTINQIKFTINEHSQIFSSNISNETGIKV